MSQSKPDVPIVAIITRTKNRPYFLKRSVDSVLSQTYINYVHVILNDGGNKAEVEAVLADRPDDDRRIVIHNTKSVGLAGALNQAIRASRSEYVCILDDDDAWHAERLQRGLQTMLERDAKASIVPMEVVVEGISKEGEIREVERKPHPESWCGEVSLYRQAHRNFLSNGAIMYRREVYDELNGYDETLLTAEDWDFGIRLMELYNVEQIHSEDALVYYHQRPDIKTGDIGNSVHAGVNEQERTIMIIRNNYLRRDLKKGVMGVGYIMNDVEQGLIGITRIEGHINRSTKSIIDSLDSVDRSVVNSRLLNKIQKKFHKKR